MTVDVTTVSSTCDSAAAGSGDRFDAVSPGFGSGAAPTQVPRRRGAAAAAGLLIAAVTLWAALFGGTFIVFRFGSGHVAVWWLIGAVIAFPFVSTVMRGATQRLLDALDPPTI